MNPFSGTLPYSQVRQGLDTCHLTVMIKATKNMVYDKGREASWGKEDIEDLKERERRQNSRCHLIQSLQLEIK